MFHKNAFKSGAGFTLFVLAAIVSQGGQAQHRVRHTTRSSSSLSTGTVIPVTLNDALSSKTANRGDTFTTTVSTNADDSTALPAGSTVTGIVRSVSAKTDRDPGTLDVAFNRITLPNGRSYAISGSPIGLDSKSVTRQNGHMVAKNGRSGPSRLTYVGIGAGAGLLVNILTHRKGTLLDTLIGAGAGYAAGSLIKGKSSVRDVDLSAGTKMGVNLNRSVAIGR